MSTEDKTLSLTQVCWLSEEVNRQKAGPKYVGSMAEALLFTQTIEDKFTADDLRQINAKVLGFGRESRYRDTPVTFADGGSSCHPQSVPYAMGRLLEHIPEKVDTDGKGMIFAEDVDAWIKQFLWIHPFEDGNGRVAALLFNWLLKSLDSPISFRKFEF